MPDFNIEKVFVHPVRKVDSLLKGFARIQIEGGLFISELRIFQDSKLPDKLYIAFPTRAVSSGENRKVVYPITDEARKRITEAITEQYNLEVIPT